MPTIEELYWGHLGDPKIDCSAFEPTSGFPACELSHDSAIELVTQRLRSYGYETSVVQFQGEPVTAYNVIGERRGSTLPDEVVLIGAHLDAFYGGADDNSSAVAAMLEIARVFSTQPTKRSLRFVGFDLEEYGLRGSQRYVDSGAADDVTFALVLETIGFSSKEPDSQTPVPGLPTGNTSGVGDFIAAVGNDQSAEMIQRLTGLNHEVGWVKLLSLLGSGNGAYPVTGQLMRSDHGPFWTRNIPAMMLCDSANYRNPNYHKSTDTPETLDPTFIAGVTRLAAATVSLAAEVAP
jgi:Zn-dependent M28 family amino/carboxypeptidase